MEIQPISVIHYLRAVVSPGRALRYKGGGTTASNHLLFHRAYVKMSNAQMASLPLVSQETLGTYIQRQDGNKNVIKTKGLILIKQQLCTCITLFCAFLCRLCTTTTWKCLISHFTDNVNRWRRNFISLPEPGYGPKEFNSSWDRLHLTK